MSIWKQAPGISRRAKKREFIRIKQAQAKERALGSQRFYTSEAWRMLRYRVIVTYGKMCMACGETRGRIDVDHIKPRSRYPELQFDFNNLQILCESCNLGKKAWDETDWRPKNKSNLLPD